jgi:ABC-type maltose transport system permease subunit
MKRLVAPVCLVMCLALLITAFAMLSMEAPQASIALHRARVTGDEQYRDVLEADLAYRIWLRRGLIVALFVAAGALGVSAFFTVAGSDP